MKFYLSVFKNSKIIKIARYTEVGPGPKGSVLTIAFKLDGQEFLAINGGPDRNKADRVMRAMMPMKKIDLAALLKAAKG